MGRRKQEETPLLVQEPLPEMSMMDGEVQLTPEELYRLLYLDAKVKNLELTRRLKTKEIDDQLRQIKDAFDKFSKEVTTQRDQAFSDMQDTRKQIEEKRGIKMSDYTLDEITGKLTKLLGPKEA